MNRSAARSRLPVDRLLFTATLALLVIGLWMVFDASYVKTLDSARMGHDAFFFVKRQAVGAILGLGALFTMMRVGYWHLRRLAVPLMLLGLVCLCAVWLPRIGINENHANRWVALGPIRFQPSELAKLTLIIYLAALLSRVHCNVRDLGQGLGPPLAVTTLYLILIEREPDLGTAFVLFLAVLTQCFLAGARKRHLALVCAVGGLAVLLMGFGFGHRAGRITTFLHPEKDTQGIGYQIFHSRLAIGSGGWSGAGLGEGREKYFLPQGNTDFIFATIAEELGFFRTASVLGLLCLVGWRGFRIACQTRDRFGALLAAGIAALISWQALINVAVATASIPATGVPLPFISYGSSSLVFLLAGIGILLNIAQNPTPPGQPVETHD
ncbi:MAG TPA: putative lipid II flippase FtsW [Chthonomonadaceae bacterium]|nr:putative lipid II flippase FtsW [Chthonomonadaceae bacterium]